MYVVTTRWEVFVNIDYLVFFNKNKALNHAEWDLNGNRAKGVTKSLTCQFLYDKLRLKIYG